MKAKHVKIIGYANQNHNKILYNLLKNTKLLKPLSKLDRLIKDRKGNNRKIAISSVVSITNLPKSGLVQDFEFDISVAVILPIQYIANSDLVTNSVISA